MTQPSTAFIGLGANLDDPVESFRKALDCLNNTEGVKLEAVSCVYRSAPVGYAEQPDFLNAATAVATSLKPEELLTLLLGIESDLGRSRKELRYGPRNIDLDLLLFDSVSMHTDRLTLPHPRLHERRFALQPIAEIDPGATVPGHGLVVDLLANVDDGGLQLLLKDWYHSTPQPAVNEQRCG